MEKSDNKAIVIKKVLVALITILLIAYIVSVVLKSNFTQVKTEAGNIMTVSDAIPVSGYFIRDEYLIENNEKGIAYTIPISLAINIPPVPTKPLNIIDFLTFDSLFSIYLSS